MTSSFSIEEEPECRELFHNNGNLYARTCLVNDVLHNTKGPSSELWDKKGRIVYREFCVNGVPHNVSGPAFEWWKRGSLVRREFWVNGKKMSEEEFLALHPKSTVKDVKW